MRRLAAAVATLLVLSVRSAAEDAAPASLDALDVRLGESFRKGRVPGASVAVVEDGQVTLAKAYGLADVAGQIPATADTPFRAGSISKSVTGIAVMTLVEQGKLSLEARLADLAPEVAFVNPWENSDPVRLVNLLEHTTGWPDIGPRILTAEGKGWPLLMGVQASSFDFVSRWRPGYFPVYNNAGPAVAGFVIEKATGQSFDAYVRDTVLRPMGMASADFDLPPALAARMAKSYEADGRETPYQYIILGPAGSLTVSARELAQLVRFYLGRGEVDGARILAEPSVARVERSDSTLASRYGFTNGYGLGDAPIPDAGVTFHGHNGGIDGFTSVLGYSVATHSGYVLMANGGEGVDFASPASQLVRAYLTRNTPLKPPPTFAVEAKVLERYAGIYRSITPPNRLLRPFVEILGLVRVSAADGHLVVSGNAFYPTAEHSFRRSDRDEPTLAFLEHRGEVYRIGPFGAARKEPLWRVALIATVGLAIVGGLLVALLLTPVWILAAVRGRLANRGGAAVRLLPPSALIAVALTFGLPIAALSSSGMTGVHRLATVGPYSLAIFVSSLLFPLLAALGLRAAWRARQARATVRRFAHLTCAAVLVLAAYAAAIGWIGIRTWTM